MFTTLPCLAQRTSSSSASTSLARACLGRSCICTAAASGYDEPLRRLATESGSRVVAPHQRLAPEHPFPAALDDSLLAARWLHDRWHSTRITGVDLPDARRAGDVPVVRRTWRGVRIHPRKSLWFLDQYLPPGLDRSDPRVSPLYKQDLRALPTTRVITAECDPLRDEAVRFAYNLQRHRMQVEHRSYRGMIHGFFQMTGALDASRRLHAELGTWIAPR
jgi:acetyl esterase